jgi:hypothetical protein
MAVNASRHDISYVDTGKKGYDAQHHSDKIVRDNHVPRKSIITSMI